jgi:hypothetical protein
MTQIHWTNPVSGDFTTAADWAGGVVPGAADDAILDAAGAPYTVSASTSGTVESVQTAANATLLVTSGTGPPTGVFTTLTATDGTGVGVNAGEISITAGATLVASGMLDNAGKIALGVQRGFNHGRASLTLDAATTLTGGGTVSLNFQSILGQGADIVLTNTDNTISGAGGIEIAPKTHGGIALVNEAGGVIDANVPGRSDYSTLVVTATLGITNAGVMEASAPSAELYLVTSMIHNTGGEIEATGGGRVGIPEGSIDGGVIFAGGEGSRVNVTNVASATDVSLSTAVGGGIDILNISTVTTAGVIANAGFIQLGFEASDIPALILDGNTTVTGGGTISLEGPLDRIEGTGPNVSLTNVDNTITGNGNLGSGELTLVNQTAGVIEAVASLTIDTGTNTVVNAGLIESSVATEGNILISSPVKNTGTLEAAGGTLSAGGTLTVDGKVTGTGTAVIGGGTLDFNAGFNEKVTFTGTTGVLELAKSVTFLKPIVGFSKTGGTSLDLGDIAFVSADEATYSGTTKSGVLTVTDGTHTAQIHLTGDYTASIFVATSDGRSGTIVIDTTSGNAASAHRFIAAAAGLGRSAGEAVHAGAARADHATMLARPHAMIA